MDQLQRLLSDSIGHSTAEPGQLIPQLLSAIRTHFAMDVAFVSAFAEGKRVFRYVDAARQNPPSAPGHADLLDEGYCQRVADGRLPELIRDVSGNPEARTLAVTAELPVGAQMSVSLKFSDDSVFGAFCCFSFLPDESLTEGDVGVMKMFADIFAQEIERDLDARKIRREQEMRIQSVLTGDAMSMVYQPIHEVAGGQIVGFEALARFTGEPWRTPDVWFGNAAAVGLGTDLELRAVELALEALRVLPKEVFVAVNASPETLTSDKLVGVLEDFPLDRIVLEITEHAVVEQYENLTDALEPLRAGGARLAVDDAGAGYASFRHILSLAPDKIKLDQSITRNIDIDRRRRALAVALIAFGHETGSSIVAEGVETAEQYEALRAIGVDEAQGYLLGRPVPVADIVGCIP